MSEYTKYDWTPEETSLFQHVTMFGSAGYPVRKLGRGWIVDDAFGVKGSPVVYKTKRAAVAQFEAWMDAKRDQAAAFTRLVT